MALFRIWEERECFSEEEAGFLSFDFRRYHCYVLAEPQHPYDAGKELFFLGISLLGDE
jgi:hypothetical protein